MDKLRKHTIMEIDCNEIGTRIKHRRKSMGITQTELAKILEVSKYHISHIESGKAMPSLELIIKLSFRLNTTPDFFFSAQLRHLIRL